MDTNHIKQALRLASTTHGVRPGDWQEAINWADEDGLLDTAQLAAAGQDLHDTDQFGYEFWAQVFAHDSKRAEWEFEAAEPAVGILSDSYYHDDCPGDELEDDSYPTIHDEASGTVTCKRCGARLVLGPDDEI